MPAWSPDRQEPGRHPGHRPRDQARRRHHSGLLDNPALQEVTAIKNQNFYTITHVSFYCGSMQTIEDIEGLSEMHHK